MRKNLIIVRAGDHSLHPRWMGHPLRRKFDLFVSYYGDTPDKFKDECEYYHVMKGPRWPAHDDICTRHWDLLQSYERIAFVCDDLDAAPTTWAQLFRLTKHYELDVAQPAVLGHTELPITRPKDGVLLRYTNWVEIMSPVFSPRALELVRGTFRESVSGWGLDILWSGLLPYPEYKLAIVDAVRVTHTGPVRGGELRPVLDALGIEPPVEMARLFERHGLRIFKAAEYARLTIVD